MEQAGRRRGWAAILVAVLAAAVVGCAEGRPVPSAAGPSPDASPSSPVSGGQPTDGTSPDPGATAGASPTGQGSPMPIGSGSPVEPSALPHEDVYIRLVELAAEDPSPGGTYVVLATDALIPWDVGCWRLITSQRDDLVIAPGSRVPGGGGLRLLFDRGDVANPDRLELRDETGRVVDATPELHDTAGDDQLFGRSGQRWTLGRPALPDRVVDGGFDSTGC